MTGQMFQIIFAFMCITATILSTGAFAINIRTPIKLDNNGYTGLLIAIHERVPEDLAILDRLQVIFTDASKFLYEASRHYTYIHDVTILLPETWSDNPFYERATWETFDIANVLVDEENPQWAHNPYTKQTLPCGKPGEYIHITPKWITDVDFSTYFWGDSGTFIYTQLDTNDRLNLLVQAATRYIRHTLPMGSWLGMVEFSTWSRITTNLTQLTDDQIREDLIDLLPKWANGNTCIGCGILDGIQVLLEYNTTKGGVLFVITDGQENEKPYIRDVMDIVVEAGIVVDTLAFSKQADAQLTIISEITGGRAYYSPESSNSTALHDAFFTSVVDRELSDNRAPVQITSKIELAPAMGTVQDYTNIDSTIGSESIFFFFIREFSTPRNVLTVELTSPSGSVLIDKDSPEYRYEHRTRTVTISMPGHIETGRWTYLIQNSYQDVIPVEVSVESKAADVKEGPMKLTSTVGTPVITETPPKTVIYAELRKGHSAVTRANVVAVVERPGSNDDVTMQLMDNGMGADITKDDGVYSAYFLDFVKTDDCIVACRYTVTVEASDLHGGAGIQSFTYGSGALPTNSTVIPSRSTEPPTPIGDFDRSASGGVIQIDDSIVITEEDLQKDGFAPSRITDLRIVNFTLTGVVQLGWTATGDDMDKGTAAYYDLRMSTTFAELFSVFGECLQIQESNLTDGTLLSPLPAGSPETVTILMPNSNSINRTYYFAIVAVDEVGSRSVTSNFASVSAAAIAREPVPNSSAKLDVWHIVLLSVLCAAILSIVIFVVAYVINRKSRSKNRVRPFEENDTVTRGTATP
ncbi:calcium-activated chloride channel regulator 1-like [Saccoglossus kowalevskii]|uniref:Calcium-activated chloride channel regulator 4-like n=1 Tax=Saccoglossus kowalevskii TaxID=10224 RepID=A0ABM0LYV4_SACKO|nr:PREDICTED: calcium-activated chloride channel regulator 4-like [Saccoglossus kowalevskii]